MFKYVMFRYYLLVIILQYTICIFDRDSYIVKYLSQQKIQKGIELCQNGFIDNALSYFESSYSIDYNAESIHYAILCIKTHQQNAIGWLHQIGLKYPNTYYIQLFLALEYHYNGQYNDAINIYQHTIRTTITPNDELYFNLAVSYHHAGMLLEAFDAYTHCLSYNPQNTRCGLNFGSLHQSYDNIYEAICIYETLLHTLYYTTLPTLTPQLLSNRTNSEIPSLNEASILLKSIPEYHKVKLNLGLAYIKIGKSRKSSKFNIDFLNELDMSAKTEQCYSDRSTWSEKNVSIVINNISLSPGQYAIWYYTCTRLSADRISSSSSASSSSSDVVRMSEYCNNVLKYETQVLFHLWLNYRSSVYWQYKELYTSIIVTSTLRQIYSDVKNVGPLLPFDTLLLSLPSPIVLIIAYTTSFNIQPAMQSSYYNKENQILYTHRQLLYNTYGSNNSSCSSCSGSSSSNSSNHTSSDMFIDATYAVDIMNMTQDNDLNMRKYHSSKLLRIGFMSYDFNDHPTAHLVEAIFTIIYQYKNDHVNSNKDINNEESREENGDIDLFLGVELIIFSYGKHDNSTYRLNLEKLADVFVDVILESSVSTAEIIESYHIDILLDMQVHTYGHRLNTIAGRPSPIQINYLVYPGTSGSAFHDYLVTDFIVTPPEVSTYYSESFIYFPPTYQISYFDRYQLSSYNEHRLYNNNIGNKVSVNENPTTNSCKAIDNCNIEMLSDTSSAHQCHNPSSRRLYKMSLRKKYGLPYDDPNTIIFCNFNKVDKLDLDSFIAWLQIMRRVPNSYLWLLLPSLKKKTSSKYRHRHNSSVDHNVKNVINTTKEIHSNYSDHNNNEEADDITESQYYIVKENLESIAMMMGISKHRLIYANYVNKTDHIVRHQAADLFLDTFIYGAHSTATDALRGGLLVLTLSGEAFPSRVAYSLYASMSSSKYDMSLLFVSYTVKEFENIAVKYVTSLQSTSSFSMTQSLDTASDIISHSSIETPVFLSEHETALNISVPTLDALTITSRKRNNLSSTTPLDILTQEIIHLGDHQNNLFNTKQNVKTFIRSMFLVREMYKHILYQHHTYHNSSSHPQPFSMYRKFLNIESNHANLDINTFTHGNTDESLLLMKLLQSARNQIIYPHIVLIGT